MSEENREVSKKEKLYTALTVAEIVVGIVGIALFVVLCRTEEDFHRYIVALLLAIIMIVNGTYGLFKKPNNKKRMTENEDCRNKMPVLRRCGRVRRRRKNGDRTEKKTRKTDRKRMSPAVLFFRTVSFLRACPVTDAPV